MKKEENLLLKSKELERKEKQIEELKESYSSALKEIDKLIKTQEETVETFSNLLEQNEETSISFDEEFLKLYKKNSKEIIERLDSVSGSAVSLEQKIDINNGYLETVSYAGIISVCGLGFISGLILMSIFSRFFKI